MLILAPHADDEIIGCGGVIQKYLKNGSAVRVVIASFVHGAYQKYQSEKGQYQIYDGTTRLKELEQSYQVIGIENYHFLYTDKDQVQYHSRLDTIPRIELASKLENEIQEFKPTVIYIPSITKHQDHTALHEAALTATRPYFWRGSVLVYETDGELSFQPNVFVPINRYEIDKKQDALKVYKTQVGSKRHPISPQALLTKAMFRGQSIYSDFAEAFQVIRIHG
ncbi:MAG TPA: PIG-L family deacetylase [Bacillales bacterium]|nr:PIG-L family deacetylase [Bacillales bacterium]